MKRFCSLFRRLCYTSKIFTLLCVIFLVPILLLLPYPQERRFAWCFAVPALLTLLLGIAIDCKKRYLPSKQAPSRQHEIVVVVAIWFYAFVIGGMPFFLAGLLDPLKSVFESVSGWTATGFTMLDVTETPYLFLFYRSWMQFCGGIGFVLLILVFAGGTDAMKLFSAEGHPDKLEANLIGTARLMMLIYAGLTIIGAILYMIFGMAWFDAVCHSMSALATGGFSTKAQGIAFYNSIPIEITTIILMLLGGTNFAILALLVRRQMKKLCRIGETKFMFCLLFLAVPAITLAGLGSVYNTAGESLRVAVFQSVSAITSTGYSIASFDTWRPSMMLVLLLLMIIGGGTGSTAGGMKYSRVYMLAVYFWHTLKAKFYPERAVKEAFIYKPQGKLYLTPKVVLPVHHFALVYLTCFFLGSLLLTFAGIPMDKAMFEFGSALGTIGLSTGVTNASAGSFVLCVQIIGMILARLEVYIVFVFFAAMLKKWRRA